MFTVRSLSTLFVDAWQILHSSVGSRVGRLATFLAIKCQDDDESVDLSDSDSDLSECDSFQ